jgi:hypothetical protein
LATEALDGIAATDLVGEYDINERWGAQVTTGFETMGLSQSLTASLFTTDRTALSESLFTNRGRFRLSDGGAGNREGIGSFVAVYDGCKGAEPAGCFDDGEFGYRIGFRYQKAGLATTEQRDEDIKPRDEFGYLGAATARIEIDDETALRLLGEVAYFRNFEGGSDQALIGTGSLSLERGPVTVMATYSRQRNLIAGEPDTTEHLVDLTASYDFGDERSIAGETWKLAAGYSFEQDEDGERAHTLSLLLTIDLEGSLGNKAGKEPD